MFKLELNINGMKTLPDVITMIKETIDNGDKESAKDYLNLLQEYLVMRDSNILELQKTGEKILDYLEENKEHGLDEKGHYIKPFCVTGY